MTIRKTLLSILAVVFIAGIAQAQLAKVVSDSLYEIPKTTVAPVIDGVIDPVWKTIDWNFQKYYSVDASPEPDDRTDLTGMTKALYDDENLYILFYNQDDDIQDLPAVTGQTWNKDAVEIYIDGDNTKVGNNTGCDPGDGRCPQDFQITIPHEFQDEEADTVDGLGLDASIDLEGIEFKIADVDADGGGLGGWLVEFKIPLATCGIDPTPGNTIGWELQQDEADAPDAGRTAMSKWWNNTNNSWTDASIWGNAVLSDQVVDSAFIIRKIPADVTINIDGVMDAAYLAGNRATINEFRVGDPPTGVLEPDNVDDAFLAAYVLYNDENLYYYLDVTDDDIQDNPTVTGQTWNKDAVEIYIDGDNTKVGNNTGCDPGDGRCPQDFQITIPHEFEGEEADTTDGLGLDASIELTGIEFKIITKDEGGWAVEFKIPLATCGIDPTEGNLIGFDLQVDESDADDANARGSMEKWWSPSNNSWTDASIWGTAKLGPEVVVGVRPVPSQVPAQFALGQNYPNPFNPSTKITFSVSKADLVTLKVFNLLGQEVATLVNEQLAVNNYEVTFDAANLPSGVYFYTITTGNSSITKKMMLLK